MPHFRDLTLTEAADMLDAEKKTDGDMARCMLEDSIGLARIGGLSAEDSLAAGCLSAQMTLQLLESVKALWERGEVRNARRVAEAAAAGMLQSLQKMKATIGQ